MGAVVVMACGGWTVGGWMDRRARKRKSREKLPRKKAGAGDGVSDFFFLPVFVPVLVPARSEEGICFY